MPGTSITSELQSIFDDLKRGETSDRALQEIKKLRDSAHKAGETEDEARAVLAMSVHFMVMNNNPMSKDLALKGLELVDGTGSDLETDLNVMLCRVTLANDVEQALRYIRRAHKISVGIHGTARPNVSLRYGEALAAAGDVKQALSYMREAELAYELADDLYGRSTTLRRICALLLNTGHNLAVVEYASEAIAISQGLGSPLAEMNAFKFLAMALTRVGQLSEAFEVARKALDLAEQRGRDHMVADCTGVLGDVYRALNDLPSALRLYSRSLSLYREFGFKNGEAYALNAMAEIYAKADKYEDAEKLFDQADTVATEISNKTIRRSVAIGRAGMYARMGRKDEADKILESVSLDIDSLTARKPTQDVISDAVRTFRRVTAGRAGSELPPLDSLNDEINIDQLPKPAPASAPDADTAPKGIHVQLFGSFRVFRDGTEISRTDWKRKKARDVFKFLAARHGTAVSTDEIVLNLWGEDVPPESCLPTLQNSVSTIRAALEPGLKPRQPSSYITFRDNAYTLDLGKDGSVDTFSFKGLVERAYAADGPVERGDLLKRATSLYTGDLLPEDRFEPWTEFLRVSLRESAVDALDTLASVYLELGDKAAAQAATQRARELDDDE